MSELFFGDAVCLQAVRANAIEPLGQIFLHLLFMLVIPVIAMILGIVDVPAEGIGVDRFLDMCRTAVNVTGDLAAAVVVSRGERHAG